RTPCRPTPSLTVLVREVSSMTSNREQSEPAGCSRRHHVRQLSTRGSSGPTLPGSAPPRLRYGTVIDPDFDPGGPWRHRPPAAIALLLVSVHLALWLASTVHLIQPLEPLLG